MSKTQAKNTHSARTQLDTALAALIKKSWAGDRLPAEPTLAKQLGVSRATLREALRSFEERGLVVRRHGAGTFVAPPPPIIEGGLEVLESIESMAGRIGLKIRMGTAVIEEHPASKEELKWLGRKSATQVLSVARTILVRAQPVAYLVDIVPVEYLHQDDLGEDFNGSVLDVLRKRRQQTLTYSHTNLIAAMADATLAKQLRVQRGSPLLKLEAQLYAQDSQILDYSISHFVSGHFRFHVIRRIENS
jgi:GntR family transcriptional regulator